jgi:hypothetical protein
MLDQDMTEVGEAGEMGFLEKGALQVYNGKDSTIIN